MKKNLIKYIAAAMLLLALAGASFMITESLLTKSTVVQTTTVNLDHSLSVLP